MSKKRRIVPKSNKGKSKGKLQARQRQQKNIKANQSLQSDQKGGSPKISVETKIQNRTLKQNTQKNSCHSRKNVNFIFNENRKKAFFEELNKQFSSCFQNLPKKTAPKITFGEKSQVREYYEEDEIIHFTEKLEDTVLYDK